MKGTVTSLNLPRSAPRPDDFDSLSLEQSLNLIPVLTLNLQRIALDRAPGPATLFDLFEEGLQSRLRHPCLKDHRHGLPAPFLSTDLHLSGSGGSRDLGQLLTATG